MKYGTCQEHRALSINRHIDFVLGPIISGAEPGNLSTAIMATKYCDGKCPNLAAKAKVEVIEGLKRLST